MKTLFTCKLSEKQKRVISILDINHHIADYTLIIYRIY